MTNNMIGLISETEKATLYKIEIDRIERKMLDVGTSSPLFEYLCNEKKYFKEKLARQERFCEYLVNKINEENERK